MNRYLKVLLAAMVILVCISMTFLLTVTWMQSQNTQLTSIDAVNYKMQSVSQLLERYYIDEYDASTVEAAAADGAAASMIEAVGDRWSYYISAADMGDYEEQMTNTYVGVGIVIQEVDNGIEVMSVTPGSPAEEVGVLPGDICVAVAGQKVKHLGFEATQELVRGEPGTFVNMTFLRDGKTLELTVERRAIVTDVSTLTMMEDGIALIRIRNFDLHCAEQTLACLDEAVAQGAKALLFDVRFNGGGMKDEMVEILDALLPEGEVFRSVDYRGVEEIDTSDADCLSLPMAVLVNEDSYSAAEFFAAALQEYGVAQVVGTKTSGKGNYQFTLDLGDGSAVALSVGKYFTPSGISLTDVGIAPNVEVDLEYDDYLMLYYETLPYEDDAQLQAALSVLK